MSQVTFSADNGTEVTVLLDAASPVLTDGIGGWEVVDRPKRPGMTRFKGHNPYAQDIAILFDGWIDNQSQESRIATLLRMGEQAGDLLEPPKIKLDGMALRTDLTWIIQSIDWATDNVIWAIQGGNYIRYRQAAVVHLIEFVDDQVLVTPATPAIANKDPSATGKTSTTQTGMTLKQVAQLEYGDPDLYYLILVANAFLNPDPRVIIPAGTTLNIPAHGNTPPGTFTIPFTQPAKAT